jgi:transposase
LVKELALRGKLVELESMLRTLKEPFAICYEASCGYGHLYDRLGPLARRVVVAHPGQTRLIFHSKRKNDRIDAKKLATLLFLDQVPAVHVPSVEVRSWRGLIEFRRRLIDKRTRVKNALRGLLRGHGVDAPRGKRLWTREGRAWLASLEWPTALASVQRDMLLDELTGLEQKVGRVTGALDQQGRTHPGVKLLRTIPGVGPRTAEAVVAYIDNPARFERSKQVGCYFGLVPCEDTSVQARYGHITREGPATVRKYLIEAAWQGIHRCTHLKTYFERVAKGDPDNRKLALVATAHYLVRVMWAMLKSGEAWRYDDQKKEKAA